MLREHQESQHQHQHQHQQYNNVSPQIQHRLADPFGCQVGQRRERWVLNKTLGSGGFGTVTLWKNEDTGEELAIKKCRLGANMSNKSCQRWQIEVDIMKRLRHNNVVSGCEVPVGLQSLQDDLPLLAMEYCPGGDLRKVLNNAKNCCGMNEFDVRWLASDISTAVEYLHNNRIIHRDLKPENIVHKNIEDRTLFKLIDLGYAKELDQSSVCHSFVGTLQYLAPELYMGQKYTQTVDYWSFGTVMFEALTGTRPFLPNSPPLKWHNEVKKKSDDDICAYFDYTADVKFSNKLFTPNHLSRFMQKYFEDWLRQMLRWDPKHRGGGISSEGRPRCFAYLDKILAIKISHILYVENNQLISVPLSSNMTMQELQYHIEQQTKIPANDQDLLLASGKTPDYSQPASQCWSEPGIEEWLVYLFRKSDTTLTCKGEKVLPTLVQAIVQQPKVMLSYTEHRKAWAHAVYFCQEQNQDFKRLLGGQRAAMLSLLRSNSEFVILQSTMMSDVKEMMATTAFFKNSLELDMLRYEEQKDEGLKSDQMFSKWEKHYEDMDKITKLKHHAMKLDQEATVLQAKIRELQNSPFARGKKYPHLVESEEKARTLYSDLRQAGRDQRNDMFLEHTQMVEAVTLCVYHRNKSVGEMMAHISKICSCRSQLNGILPELERCCEEVHAANKQLLLNQKSRQQDIWNILKVALGRAKNLSRSNSRKLSQTGSGSASPTIVQSCQSSPNLSGSSQPQSISAGKYESLRVINDYSIQTNRMNDMIRSLMSEQDENMSLGNSLTALLDNTPVVDYKPTDQTYLVPMNTTQKNMDHKRS